jgi:RimJ/RimL family protein N-acetyltransferase
VAGRVTTILKTERLTIRRLELDDAAFILQLLNEPPFIENIADKGVRTLEDAKSYLRDVPLASYARHGFGLWRLGLKAGDVSIGIAGILKRDTMDDIELGYALLTEYWGRGYALEAATGVMAYARQQLGLDRIAAVVHPTNAASIVLLEKLCFEYERMVRLAEGEAEIKLFASTA